MPSIRTFLIVILLSSMTLINFLVALHGYQSSMAEAEKVFDLKLSHVAELLSDIQLKPHVNSGSQSNGIVYQVWNNDALINQSIDAPDLKITEFKTGFDYKNFNNYRWRTYTYENVVSGSWVMVAERDDVRYTIAENIILETTLPILLGLPLIGLMTWFIVGRGLNPLQRVAKQLQLKKMDDLSALPSEGLPSELSQIVYSINDLLLRLKGSFDRENRFASDAAHELRTPLSVLKVHLHNLSNDMTESNSNIKSLNEGVDRMAHLVEQILALYRTTPDQYITEHVVLDLHGLTKQVLADNYAEFNRKQQQIELTGSETELVGDKFALETLIKNLLSNANKYTPEGGVINIAVYQDDNQIILSVDDSGIGIPEHEYKRAFDRFYRVGGDRHNSDVTGCGLGLSIVSHIVDMHGASIELKHSSFESGLCVVVKFGDDNMLGSNL